MGKKEKKKKKERNVKWLDVGFRNVGLLV